MAVIRWGLHGFAALVVGLLAVQLWFTTWRALPERAPGSLRVASHNVHWVHLSEEAGPWTIPGWEARKGSLDLAFKALDADVVAFQEMESFGRGMGRDINLTRAFLAAQNPDYAMAATGPSEAFPPTQPVFYRPARLSVEEEGWFFFSETPEVMYSRSFDGGWPAFAAWVRFRTGEGQVFTLVNVHFDYASRMNRRLSAEMVAARMGAMEGPLILTGDLNALSGSYTIRQLEGIGLVFPRVPGATVHWNLGLHLFGAIDRIGASREVAFAQGPFVVQRRYDGRWPSDHHPVVADLTLP